MNNHEYNALRSGAAFQVRPTAGVLELSDNDRVDFLQRMTTNDVAVLKTGESTVTVLPSPTARVLFAFTIIAQEETLLCLPAVGQTEALSKHLRSQIFFMDKVKVANLSEEMARLRLMGAEADKVIARLGVPLNGDANDGAVTHHNGMIIVKQIQYDIPGYEMVVQVEDLAQLVQNLIEAGTTQLSNPESEDEPYTTRRVEVGRPAVDHELVDDYSPLEAGLAWTCAENKGCYTGQEIIARQITYDKVTKTLVGLRSDLPFTQGGDVIVEGRSAGRITSTAYSSDLEQHIALAILKRPHNQPGTHVQVGDGEAVVSALPMSG